jgi:hypothetical protein
VPLRTTTLAFRVSFPLFLPPDTLASTAEPERSHNVAFKAGQVPGGVPPGRFAGSLGVPHPTPSSGVSLDVDQFEHNVPKLSVV